MDDAIFTGLVLMALFAVMVFALFYGPVQSPAQQQIIREHCERTAGMTMVVYRYDPAGIAPRTIAAVSCAYIS
jgi:hypothetical protein